jgi:SAM-dependent methyltransferase
VRALSPDEALRRSAGTVWLDVRGEDAFRDGHLPGAGNVPLVEWDERRHELPPRALAITVVADDPRDAAEAARRLEAARYTSVAYLDAPWSAVERTSDTGPPRRLWRPAPFLEEVLPELPRGHALDVACGSGRDAVFMALAGFDVEAWDHDEHALAAVRRLAGRHRVAIDVRAVDLEAPRAALPESRYMLVVCFRFLHRPLFQSIARALQPGGHLVYETFRDGQQRFGKPVRPRFLLRPGELASAFEGLETLRYEETAPPGGPLTARLLARRPDDIPSPEHGR